MTDKEKLRKSILAKRARVSNSEHEKISQLIFERLIASPEYLKADTIHCYAAMEQRGEVGTKMILEHILSSGKTLVMSKMAPNKHLLHFKVTDMSLLQSNSFGILEPVSGKQINPNEPDLLIIPLLACDEKGNRLGYGAGYYDRFLKETKGFRLGVCAHDFLFPTLPTEKHDVPLHGLLTEHKWYRFTSIHSCS